MNTLIRILFLLLAINVSVAATVIPVATNNFNNGDCNLNFPILDQTCEDYFVNVSGENGTLGTDVIVAEVRFIIEHEWDADIDMYLTAPTGQVVELTTDNGSGGDDYGIYDGTCTQYTTLKSNLLVSSCSTPSVQNSTAPFTGVYLPEGNLSDFNSGTPNGSWVLNICDDQPEQEGVLRYFEIVFTPLDCAIPSNISAYSVDSTFATLNWLAQNNCSNSIIEYGVTGFTLGTGTTLNVGCPPYQLSNLTESTTYDIYIAEACQMSSGVSDFSCPITFTTQCSPAVTTLMEDFDNQNICAPSCNINCPISGTWFNIQGDDTDWIVYQGATPTANTGPLTDANNNSNGGYIYLETSCSTINRKAELYSKCIMINTASNTCHLSFDYMANGATVNNMMLEITTDGTSWTTIWNITGSRGTQWLNAYIDLSAYNNETAQFRFSATKLNGSLGDVALDNIAFHGSILDNANSVTYYADNDGDGYGNLDQPLTTCFGAVPNNYSPQGGDCDDNNPFVYPGAFDYPCDGIDTNCDPSDDNLLDPPFVMGNTTCSGTTDTLYAYSIFNGELSWYDAPVGGNLLHTGYFYAPPVQTNDTDTTKLIRFYVEEVNALFGCMSGIRGEAILSVQPTPSSDQVYSITICKGDSIHLTDYPYIDQHQTNFTITYHNSIPATANNELPSTSLAPTENAVYFIQAKTSSGCADIISVSVIVNDTPEPVIVGGSTMCIGTTQTLSVYDNAAPNLPYTFLWTTGSEIASTSVEAPSEVNTPMSYGIQMTNSSGCSAYQEIDITSAPGIQPINVTTQAVSACNMSDGSITLSPSSGVPPYTYIWHGVTNGAQGNIYGDFTINNLAQGAYNITIKDSSGGSCAAEIPFVLVDGPAAVVQIDSIKDVQCYGYGNGGIYISTFGNTPTYQWNNGSTSQDLTGLASGNYSLTVTDNGCQSVFNNFTISEPDTVLIKTFAFQNASCANVNDGLIDVIITGGTADYDIIWNTGSTDLTLENLPVGTYTATVTDANNCIYDETSLTITAPEPIEITMIQAKDVTCNGDTNGSIEIMTTGGVGTVTTLWNDGNTLNNRSNLAPGNYTVTVTDTEGCKDTLQNITIGEPAPLTVNNSIVQNPSCAGTNNGLASVMIVGGTTPYTYLWDDNTNNATNTSLSAGSHAITINDDKGCEIVENFILEAPVAVEANYQITPTSCLGAENGRINLVNTPFGNAPFTYAWSNNATTPSLENLSPGSYTVTVTDDNNCDYIETIDIQYNQPISLDKTINQPNCQGDTTGSVAINPFGGMPLYQYNWSNGANNSQVTNLSAGNYLVTVTDAHDCYFIDTVKIEEPSALQFSLINIDNVVCAGEENGSINLRVLGGALPYQYTWTNNGSTNPNLYNVAAGDYSLVVTDANNCTVESPMYTVGEALPLSIQDNIVENEDPCQNIVAADSIELLISGGQQPYNITWSTGDSTNVLYNIQPDEYYATVTDALGCSMTYFKKISENIEEFKVEKKDTLFLNNCNNQNLQVCLEIHGGKAPYFFLWNDAVNGITSDSEFCRSINTGTYSVTVTDDNGCMRIIDALNVSPNLPLTLYYDAAEDIQHIDCFNSANGAINVEIDGGHAPYSYTWTNEAGDTISTAIAIDYLDAGVYNLTVTDAALCTVEDSWTLIAPSSLIDYTVDIINNPCKGDSLGFVNLSVTGGVPGYNYLWTNGATTQDLNNLPAGMYGVTITDNNGCVRIVDTLGVQVLEPTMELTLSNMTKQDVQCFDEANGSISLEIEGGTPQYLYEWSVLGLGDTPNLENLAPGDYSCLITDFRGCSMETPTLTIEEPEELTAELEVNNNTFTAEVFVSGGTPINGGGYIIQWSNGDTGTIGSNLPAGENYVTIRDTKGCEIVLYFDITTSTIDLNIIESASLFPNPTNDVVHLQLDLKDNQDLSIQLNNLLGEKIYTQEKTHFSSGVIDFDLNNMPAGVYFLSVLSENKNLGVWRIIKE